MLNFGQNPDGPFDPSKVTVTNVPFEEWSAGLTGNAELASLIALGAVALFLTAGIAFSLVGDTSPEGFIMVMLLAVPAAFSSLFLFGAQAVTANDPSVVAPMELFTKPDKPVSDPYGEFAQWAMERYGIQFGEEDAAILLEDGESVIDGTRIVATEDAKGRVWLYETVGTAELPVADE